MRAAGRRALELSGDDSLARAALERLELSHVGIRHRRALARLPLPVLAAVVDEPEDAGTSTAFERDERHLRRQEVS